MDTTNESPTETDGITVTPQGQQRGRRAWRYGYVITEPGEPVYASSYRYGSKEAAQRAGEEDAAQTRALRSAPECVCGMPLLSEVERTAGACGPCDVKRWARETGRLEK